MAGSFTDFAQDGETVDAICWRNLRRSAPAIEQVLRANPNLADHGLFLPRGTPVVFPAVVTAPVTKPTINLWN